MEIVTVLGTVNRTIFESKQSGAPYRIVQYICTNPEVLPERLREKSGVFTACGINIPNGLCSTYELVGYFAKSKKGKELQLKVKSYGFYSEVTLAQIRNFCVSTNFPGMDYIVAEKIAQEIGLSFFDVLINDDEKLKAIGIPEHLIAAMKDKYYATFGLHELYKYLLPLNVSVEKVAKLIKADPNILEKIKADPFSVYGKGLDYQMCCSIADYYGNHSKKSTVISCAAHSVLSKNKNSGHLFMQQNELISKVVSLMSSSDKKGPTADEVRYVIDQVIGTGKFVLSCGSVYLMDDFNLEEALARKIVKIDKAFQESCQESDEKIKGAITEAISTIPFAPEQMQVEAVEKCIRSGVSVITGGPGTGKSTVLDLVIKAYLSLFPTASIALLAPSGKAARRMQECTKRTAYTVHKYLNVTGDMGVSQIYSCKPTFPADMIIVDESSMLDIYVAAALFLSAPDTTKMVLVGDVNQLPSVGPGNVLKSIISSGKIATTTLNVIHRQGKESPIVKNSHLINDGCPELEWCQDFQFVTTYSEDETRKKCEEMYLQEVARVGIDNVAALTPFHKDTRLYSSDVMCPELQDAINPRKEDAPFVRVINKEFRKNDRIMFLRNRGDINNGDIGIITNLVPAYLNPDGTGDYLIAKFDGTEAKIEGEDLEFVALSLSYTIHKSQGSEMKSVIIPIYSDRPESDEFITRNLIYTAVTRAKERVIIVGNFKTLNHAIGNSLKPRNSYLGMRIVNQSEKQNRKI